MSLSFHRETRCLCLNHRSSFLIRGLSLFYQCAYNSPASGAATTNSVSNSE